MNKKHMLGVHFCILAIILMIPTQWAFYALLSLYLIGIPKTFKDEDEKVALQEKAQRSYGNWWEILGTEADATLAECQRVRKLLSKIYHPDGGEAPNAEHMARINRAFEERSMLPENFEQLPGIH